MQLSFVVVVSYNPKYPIDPIESDCDNRTTTYCKTFIDPIMRSYSWLLLFVITRLVRGDKILLEMIWNDRDDLYIPPSKDLVMVAVKVLLACRYSNRGQPNDCSVRKRTSKVTSQGTGS